MKEWSGSGDTSMLPPHDALLPPLGAPQPLDVSRSESALDAAIARHDMSSSSTLAAANEKAQRSAHLLEKEARRARKAGQQRHA